MRLRVFLNSILMSAALTVPMLFAQDDDLVAKPSASQQFREARPSRGPASVRPAPAPAARKPANNETAPAAPARPAEFLWTNYDPDQNDAQAEGTICLTPRCQYDRGIRSESPNDMSQSILDAATAAAKGK